MKILFDVISTQNSMNGGAEYVIRVLSELLLHKSNQVEVICLYDSCQSFPYKETSPQELSNKGIKSVDIQNNQLSRLVSIFNIDLLFIGIAQRFIKFNLSQIRCKCICVIHDFYDYDLEGIHEYLYRKDMLMLLRMKLRRCKNSIIEKKQKDNFYTFLNKCDNLSIVTVSEFTRASLLNKVIGKDKDIKVLYSPEKIANKNEQIENDVLDSLIRSNVRFYLIVNAGRILKNAKIALKAFKRYVELYAPDEKIVTIGFGKTEFVNHIDLPFLSSSDLENAYYHSYALIYPSLWEGLGDPPLEAMKYSKPVLCSNVCSMKEILGDAPIYFSPFYESEVFLALLKFHNSDYQLLSDLSATCYMHVCKKQKEDLDCLIKMITSING